MPEKPTLEDRFQRESGEDQQVLDAARECAKISKPWLLPMKAQTAGTDLPENFQSMGSRGLTATAGQVLQTLYPIDTPWYQLVLAAGLRFDPNIPPEVINDIEQKLFIRSLLGQAMLEGAGDPEDGRMPMGFRMSKLMSLNQALGTGDSLERLDDSYRITVYRRDKYTTRRGTDGQVLSHMTTESIDVLTLTDAQLEKAGINKAEMQEKPSPERMMPLITLVEYQPWTRKWVVAQEVHKKEIVTSEEPCSNYFSTPYELVAGENYGRGLIELNKGDLSSFDELNERMLDFAATASKHTPVIDEASNLTAQDMEKRSGVPLMDRVVNGVPQNVGYLKVDKINDFNVVATVRSEIRKDLGAALLIQSETVRDSERTTAFEVQQVTIRDLQARLTGFLGVAEHQHPPLARRVDYQLTRDKLVQPLNRSDVQVRILTGLSSLTHAAKAADLVTLVEVFKGLGDSQMQRLNLDFIGDMYLRYKGIFEPGAVKSPEQVQKERDQMMREAIAAAAAEKGVEVAGDAAKAALTGAPSG